MSATTNIEGQFYEIVRSSEVIEAEGKQGRKFWQGHVVRLGDQFFTTTSSWHITSLGNTSVTKWAVPYFAAPKNVGRSNETSNEQQAHLEFDSMVKKEQRLRSGERVMPMLAKTFIDKKDPKKSQGHKIRFPAVVQPKYDGMRLLTDGETAWSRGNKDQDLEKLQHLFPIETNGLILDGELMLEWTPGPGVMAPKVNQVMSAIRTFTKGITDRLVYTVYDIVDLELPYEERRKRLIHWFVTTGAKNPFVRLADSFMVLDREEGLRTHAFLTEQGYEGSIWRNTGGLYKSGKRVDDLQKHKDFVDEEFRIIGVVPQGEGIGLRRAKFVCVTEDGVEFESNATGSEKVQMGYLKDAEKLVGKYAKVKYREITEYGAPFHSNMLEVRETKAEGY